MRVKHPGAQRRRKSDRMHLVFHAERQAVQRTTVFAGRNFLLCDASFCHGLVSVDGNPSPELWVVLVNAFKAGAHQLHWRQRTGFEQASLLGAGHVNEVVDRHAYFAMPSSISSALLCS